MIPVRPPPLPPAPHDGWHPLSVGASPSPLWSGVVRVWVLVIRGIRLPGGWCHDHNHHHHHHTVPFWVNCHRHRACQELDPRDGVVVAKCPLSRG